MLDCSLCSFAQQKIIHTQTPSLYSAFRNCYSNCCKYENRHTTLRVPNIALMLPPLSILYCVCGVCVFFVYGIFRWEKFVILFIKQWLFSDNYIETLITYSFASIFRLITIDIWLKLPIFCHAAMDRSIIFILFIDSWSIDTQIHTYGIGHRL